MEFLIIAVIFIGLLIIALLSPPVTKKGQLMVRIKIDTREFEKAMLRYKAAMEAAGIELHCFSEAHKELHRLR